MVKHISIRLNVISHNIASNHLNSAEGEEEQLVTPGDGENSLTGDIPVNLDGRQGPWIKQ